MSDGTLQSVLWQLRRPGVEPATDRELLERYAQHQDEAAFTEIVRRHGALVMGVCRRLLGNHHDAEDTFQATFLVLARKAASTRWHDSVDRWLYRTAYCIARKSGTDERAPQIARNTRCEE